MAGSLGYFISNHFDMRIMNNINSIKSPTTQADPLIYFAIFPIWFVIFLILWIENFNPKSV